MPQPRKVTITIAPNLQPAPPGGAAVFISLGTPLASTAVCIVVSEEPVALRDHGTGADGIVHWEIATPGWTFLPAADGIAIANPGHHFQNNGHSMAGKRHEWQRNHRQNASDPSHRHKYTINVTNGTTTVSWDPWLVNE